MTLVQYGLDTGPESTVLTTANSGLSDKSPANTTDITFAAAAKAHGAFGARASTPAGASRFARFKFAGAVSATTWSFSGVVDLPDAPVGNAVEFFGFPNASGSKRCYVRIENTGRIQFVGRAGSSFHTLLEAVDVTWGAKYRITLVVQGGSSTASVVQGKVYRENTPGSGTFTTQVGTTLSVSTVDTGTDAVIGVDAGVTNTSAAAVVVGFDDLQLNDGSTSEIPDFVLPNDPPVVTAGAAQSVAAGATVTLAFTATDGDGSIASRATTFDYPTSGAPTITGGTTNAPTFTAGAAGSRYVVRHTATDNLGATGSATTEVFVPVAGGTTMRPEPVNGTNVVGTWTAVGAATHGAALADESDTTYNESGSVSSTPQSYRIPLQPSLVKSSGKITRRLGLDVAPSSGTVTATVRLYDNTTLRQTWTQVLTDTPTTYEFVLSGATVSAISDWLRIRAELEVVETP